MYNIFYTIFTLYFNFSQRSVTYSGRLGDRYTGFLAKTPPPKKHFTSFLFPAGFQQKIPKSNDQ